MKRYSEAEKQVLKEKISDLRSKGTAYHQIAKELGISHNSVYKYHLGKVFGKKEKELQEKKKRKYTKRSGMNVQTFIVPEVQQSAESAQNKVIMVFATINQVKEILGGS